MSPDENASGQTSTALLKVADETRAGGDLGTAVGLYRRVHEKRPTDPKPLEKLGSTLTQMGAYTEAAEAFHAGLDLANDDPDLHRGLAVVLLSLNQPGPAASEAKAALEKRKDDPRLYNIIGVAEDLMGHHEEAQDAYLNGLRLAPRSNGLRNNYGLSLALTGDYGAAATTLSEIADNPTAPPRYRLNLALVYGLAGDDKKAAAIARSALDESAVRNNLSYYALLRRMDDKARTAAIIGGQIHGTPIEPPAPEQTAEKSEPASADAPPPATPASQPAAADKDATPAATTQATAGAAPSDASAAADKAPASAEASGPPVQLARPSPSDIYRPAPFIAAPIATAPPAATAPAAMAAADMSNPAASASAPAADATPAADAPNAAAAAAPAAESAPSSAASAPSSEEASTPAPAPAPAEMRAAAAEAPAKPSATAAAGVYVVQFGSFSVEGNAHKLADQLGQKGYKVAVVRHRDQGGREWYAVRGGYPSAADAAAAARQAHDTDQLPAVVLHRAGQA
jgi:Flp pilus assembly protein TadD